MEFKLNEQESKVRYPKTRDLAWDSSVVSLKYPLPYTSFHPDWRVKEFWSMAYMEKLLGVAFLWVF